MDTVGQAVMRALAIGLGQPADLFESVVTPDPEVLVKIIRYPAQDAASDTGQGVGPHHDSGLLSFIHQDDVGGLEVLVGDAFVSAPKIPGAYVLNLGEMLQLATHGYLRATRHRVVSPPPASSGSRSPTSSIRAWNRRSPRSSFHRHWPRRRSVARTTTPTIRCSRRTATTG